MRGTERRLILGQAEPRRHPHAPLAVHGRVVGDRRVVPVQLVAPVRRRHRHPLRLSRRDVRIEHRNPDLLRRMLERIDDEEAVVAPIDAVNRTVGVGSRVALVGREFVVCERRRPTPVPHRQHEVALAVPRPRRRGRHIAGSDAIRPAREHLQPALRPSPVTMPAHA